MLWATLAPLLLLLQLGRRRQGLLREAMGWVKGDQEGGMDERCFSLTLVSLPPLFPRALML